MSEPREFWLSIKTGHFYESSEEAKQSDVVGEYEITHVREVVEDESPTQLDAAIDDAMLNEGNES